MRPPGAWPRPARVLALLWAVAALANGPVHVLPVGAENTVTLTVASGGEVTATLIEATLGPRVDPAVSRWETGRLRLVVDDPRGTAAGWSISIVASDFRGSGPATEQGRIASSDFRLLVAWAPAVVDGQPRDAGGPNATPQFGASLDAPRITMQAAPGAGSGIYEQVIDVGLEIPAGLPGGAYEGVVAIAVTAGP